MKKGIRIAEVMTPAPHTIGAEQSCKVALERMAEFRIRHLPVRRGGRLEGIASERDIHYALGVEKKSPEELRIDDVFTPNPFFVTPEASVKKVAGVMASEGYGAVLVVKDEELVGIFTTVDACHLLHDLC